MYSFNVAGLFFYFNLICFQRDSAGLSTQNNQLKFRIQAMEQQAQLRDGKSPLALSHYFHALIAEYDFLCLILKL